MWSQVWEILWFHARMTNWPPLSRKTTPNISCIQRNAPWGTLPNNCGNACLNDMEDFRVAFLFPGLRFLTHLFNSREVRQQNQFLQASELTLDHYALLASLGAMVALLLWSPWTPIWWKAEDVACQNGRRFCLFIPPTFRKKILMVHGIHSLRIDGRLLQFQRYVFFGVVVFLVESMSRSLRIAETAVRTKTLPTVNIWLRWTYFFHNSWRIHFASCRCRCE